MQVTDLFIWKRFHWYGANCHKFVNPHFVWFSRVFNIFGLYLFNLFGFLPFLTILFHYPFACLNNCFTFVFIFQWNNQRVLTATIINIQEDLTLFEFNFTLENSGTQILSFYERNILSFFRFSDNWSVQLILKCRFIYVIFILSLHSSISLFFKKYIYHSSNSFLIPIKASVTSHMLYLLKPFTRCWPLP